MMECGRPLGPGQRRGRGQPNQRILAARLHFRQIQRSHSVLGGPAQSAAQARTARALAAEGAVLCTRPASLSGRPNTPRPGYIASMSMQAPPLEATPGSGVRVAPALPQSARRGIEHAEVCVACAIGDAVEL